MSLSDSEVSGFTKEFRSQGFYKLIFSPWIKEQKEVIARAIDKLVMEDAPKNKFSVISGQRQMLERFEMAIEDWERQDQFKKRGSE